MPEKKEQGEPSANIIEIFAGIQGEGKYMGCRQIFVRLSGCNLRCLYCDTAHEPTLVCRVERARGSHRFCEHPNPFSPKETMDWMDHLLSNTSDFHAVSITGGEPLLHADFIAALAPLIHERGMKVLLETNGTLPDKLAEVIDHIDIVSMDIKFPDDIVDEVECPNHEQFWDKNKEFIRIAKAKDLYVKIILSRHTKERDFRKALSLVAKNPEIMLILQPVTPIGRYAPPSPQSLVWWQEQAVSLLNNDVRVIPQMHKMMGLL